VTAVISAPIGCSFLKLVRSTRHSRFCHEDHRPSTAATVGFSVCCDHSDSFAPTRVFSGVLARVNNRMLLPRPLTPISRLTIRSFAGIFKWAVKDSNLRPWD